jgi:hypothetical protein
LFLGLFDIYGYLIALRESSNDPPVELSPSSSHFEKLNCKCEYTRRKEKWKVEGVSWTGEDLLDQMELCGKFNERCGVSW